MSKPKLTIKFGALAPKLRDQISDARFIAHYNDVAEWQTDADAITRLMVRGLLTDSEVAASRKRLTKLITGGVAQR